MSQSKISAAAAKELLVAGNRRFQRRLAGLAPGPLELPLYQRPYAAVLTCADARVAPETIFDEPLEKLFSVRAAGHVLDVAVLGSLEFAAAVLRVPLILVMAHSDCGAVGAAWRGEKASDNLAALIEAIRPATVGAPTPDVAAERHARATVEELRRRSPSIAGLEAAGSLELAAGFYDVSSGAFDFI